MNTTSLKILLLCLLIPIISFGQSPYEIDWKKEPYYFGTGVLTLAGGIYFNSRMDPLSLEQIYALDQSNINAFDRKVTTNFSNKSGKQSDVLLLSSKILPLFIFGNKRTRNDFGKIGLLYGETFLIIGGLTSLTKATVRRTRPYVYNELASLDKKQTKGARHSFFSGHTSITASNFFFGAKVFSDYYPDSKLKPYVWTTAIIVPAATGYLRVRAGKHFYSDVIAGYAVGAAVGFLVPHFHKVKRDDKQFSLMVMPNAFVARWEFR